MFQVGKRGMKHAGQRVRQRHCDQSLRADAVAEGAM